VALKGEEVKSWQFLETAGRVVTPRCGCGTIGGRVVAQVKKISYSGYRFRAEVVRRAI
jgi:hypothetical protein